MPFESKEKCDSQRNHERSFKQPLSCSRMLSAPFGHDPSRGAKKGLERVSDIGTTSSRTSMCWTPMFFVSRSTKRRTWMVYCRCGVATEETEAARRLCLI